MEESTQVKEEHSQENMHEVKNNENVKIKEERFSSDGGSDDSGLEKDGDSEIDDDEEKLTVANKTYSDGPSKDVAEERTLFIKNLSYEATEEDIRQVLETYGAVKYVLLCIDRLTQHPRGTAFAQFLEREAADRCLEAEKDPSTKSSFILHGRPMHIMRAMSRKELQERKSDDKEVLPKDKLVREGTLAAEGISKADMVLRIKREQVKRRMLKNLHIFVSPTRLCINNLPKTVTDKELGRIFKSLAPKEAMLTEGGGGIVDKVVSVGSGRRPRVGSNPTTYSLKRFVICRVV
ncbi:RNA-binding protein 28 [Portunus trituberculatus]|uniref:RNA-binding protein 28 n=1 Tax=Portunus trituberculatus TaxID=210409 RepID=A0A5B7H3S0_PORTR|nr:RNA-binding protein 28 [Portunus trituberculatus]